VIGVGWVVIIAAPIAVALLVADLRAGRSAGRVIAGQVAIAHLAAVVALTLLPIPVTDAAIAVSRERAAYDHNAIPFATLIGQLSGRITAFDVRNIVGNVLLLLPLGLYVPLRWSGLRTAGRVLVVALVVAAAIELGQLAISTALGFPHRIADVDDVMVNAGGAMVGYGPWRLATIRRPTGAEAAAAAR
jgi:glycopeptide antibiotics resistance protein